MVSIREDARRVDATLEVRCIRAAQRLSKRFTHSGLPVSLGPLLEHFQVMQVRERPLDRDACLRLDSGDLIIEVNSLYTVARKRFGIAHEIGHLIIDQCSRTGRSHWGHGDTGIEILCDRLAGQLLAPDWAIRRYLGSDRKLGGPRSSIGRPTLREAASAFGVTVKAMSFRVFHELNVGALLAN